ncbi:PAS domain-containing protein [Geomonas nitrogeniifigens]|uniref:histidine kinase n=1 Tax=Geomonas diazotrophica TaxID=2843197 RepID=A0ABX8JJ07_9BACT|nr:MASE3 domain-containing protein [Geomonas nitrogeniifigens]QWV97487.1 PAS domain-containing protein [Geomonas nitrogeniifigens]
MPLGDLQSRWKVVLVALSVLAVIPFLLLQLFGARLYLVLDVSAYLTFHNVVELFSVMVSLSIFGVGWFSFSQSRDRHTLFLAVAFLGIGLLDFMHTLAYLGMPDLITPNSANKSTQFWIAGRFFSAAAFLASAFVDEKCRCRWLGRVQLIAGVLAIVGISFAAIIFRPDLVPDTFAAGSGLTPFKKLSELVVIVLLFLSTLAYVKRLRGSGDGIYLYYLCAFILCIVSEVAFTAYKSAFDSFNVLGHLYKLFAFLLIYRGIFAAAVKRPYREFHLALGELRHTNDVLMHIMDSIPHCIFWKDRNSVYLGCNREFARSAGLADPALIVGKTDYELPWSREESEGYRADDREVMQGNQAKMHIIENLTQADGSVIWIETSKMPLTDEDGAVRGVLGIYEDITARKKAEERLSETLQFNQEIINSAREGIIVYDRELRYLVWNPYMEEVSGVPASEVLGKRPAEVFPWLAETGLTHRLEQLLAGGAPTVAEFAARHVSGRTLWLSDASAPLRNSSGGVIGIIGTVRDVTERRGIEEQLRQAQKLESVGRLAGGVAHDFNNKLTVILGNAELAARQAAGDALLEHLRQIVKAAEQSRDITTQLLAFSRQQVVVPKCVQVNAMLEELKKSLGRLIGEHVAIVLVPGDRLWNISIDPVQLDQIVMNLAVNARDAMPQGGTITLETSNVQLEGPPPLHPEVPGGSYVRIVCRDTGAGMDAETRAHVFEPFYTTKGQGKGTGLGLATVYGIVRQNGGFIDLETEPGRGSAFSIHLPRCVSDETGQKPAPAAVLSRGTGTVLLVEDEDMVRELTAGMLEALGYSCLAIADPREALEVAANAEVPMDLVLTDVLMPGLGGQEMMARIRRTRPGIKCIYMSGYSHAILDESSASREGAAFLKKPFQMEELARLLHELLSGGQG